MTIDPKLKAAIAEKIKLAKREMDDNPELKAKLEGKGHLLSLPGDRKCPRNALLVLVERKLRKQRIWKTLRIDLVSAALWEIIRDFERKQTADVSKVELSAARERQLSLFPGFENLPTRIRSGKTFLKFPETTVPQFLVYATKYEQRAQRDQKTADELRHLAKMVEPFAELDLTMASAFERAQWLSPALTIVLKKKVAK